MPMPPAAAAKFRAHLQAVAPHCPVCGHPEFEVGDLMIFATLAPGGIVSPDLARALAGAICARCGHTLLFDAVRLGLEL